MNKHALAKKVANKTGVTITKTTEIINEMIFQIERALMSGDTVHLGGFASLKTLIKTGQKAGGLKTIKSEVIPDYRKIQVRISRVLKRRVRSNV